jgi:hypothetical protein
MAETLNVDDLAREVANGNFTDERLNKRLRLMVTGLSREPNLSLPEALDDAELEGAYRFLSNHRVTPKAILAPHFGATRQRCAQEHVVLVAHDSTSFSYRHDGAREGLGRAKRSNENSRQSFLAHFSLALSGDGTRRALGVAGVSTWTRAEAPTGTEYQRWEAQIRSSSDLLGGPKNIIHLADREADDYEMFAALQRDGHRFVVRCHHDRLLQHVPEKIKLHEVLASVPATVERDVPVNRRTERSSEAHRKMYPARDARTAHLCVAATRVVLPQSKYRRPHGMPDAPKSIELNVVHVWEPTPPDGKEPIEWYLNTTEPIDTPEQQLAIVDYYRARWTIEEYIKAIKTGCDFERRQLRDYEGLTSLLAIFAPIAYRLLLIRAEAHHSPDAPALSVVSQDELDVLRTLGRRKLSEAPTAHEIYLAIAQLGGYIKYSRTPPGWLTLARGYEKLQTLTLGWAAAKLQQRSDQG